jgi:hypothetical protein
MLIEHRDERVIVIAQPTPNSKDGNASEQRD